MRPVSATSSTTPLVDAGVELDVERRHVLHSEGVREGSGERQASAREREHGIRRVTVGLDVPSELADRLPQVFPGHSLALRHGHRTRAEKRREIVPAGPATAILTDSRFPFAVFGISQAHEARPE